MIPINIDRDGASKCIPAVYFKQGCYNFLKESFLDRGGQKEHAFTGIMEIYENVEDKDTASDKQGIH